MATLAIIGMAVFAVLLLGMSLTAGTQSSISQLAKTWRWLLLAALWSQAMLLPRMMDITPDGWQWLALFGIGGVALCGGAAVTDKVDYWVHAVAAVVAFVCLSVWVIAIDWRLMLPLAVCVCAGRDRLVWRAEIGLVISVYLTILINSLPG